jgi:hypothetical protein
MAYNRDIDYQAEIDKAVLKGDYASASTLELQRNEKIEKENLPYEKTDKYVKPQGMSGDVYNNINSSFTASDDVTNAFNKSGDAMSNYENIIGQENIISEDVINTINSEFVVPDSVSEADRFLKSSLAKIQSGRTSYTDQIKAMMSQIQNRDKFSYDVDTDPLFQQALASAMNSGKTAMQDTIGQASALTGGYGSTYATSAGNQAYNAFIEDAYDNLTQYYQMAMEKYQMEGDEMYRQLGMLNDADATEYSRMVTAYDATYAHRNQMYNEAYGEHRDEKTDAFAMANLQLNEHGQRASDAYNLYGMTSDYANNLYNREYQTWSDTINQYMQLGQMQSNDYWNKSNQEFQATESQKNREWQSAEAEKERAFTASENAKNRSVRGSGGGNPSGVVYDYTAEELAKAGSSKAVKTFKSSVLTEQEFKRRGKSATINGNTARFDTYNEYIDAVLGDWSSNKKLTETETAYLVGYYFR